MQKHTLQGLTRKERLVFKTLCGYDRRFPWGSSINRTGCAERAPRTTEYLVRRFIRNGLLTAYDHTGQPITRISTRSRTPYDFTPTPRGLSIATHLFAGK